MTQRWLVSSATTMSRPIQGGGPAPNGVVRQQQQLIVDYRRSNDGTHTPVRINGTEVERVTSFKFLGVHISKDLCWTLNTSTLIKKAHQHLFFLRRLKTVHLSPQILVNRCTIDSILTKCGMTTAPCLTGKHCRGCWKLPKASPVPHSPPLRLSRESGVSERCAASSRTVLTPTTHCSPSSTTGHSAPGPAGLGEAFPLSLSPLWAPQYNV